MEIYRCPNLTPQVRSSCMTLHGAWYFADIQLWMAYPTSLKKMLLQDVVTSTFGDICEDFENSFGALWNLFRRRSTFRNLFQTEFALPTKRLGLQLFWLI